MESIRIHPADPGYPPVLRDLATHDASDPPTLYLRGTLPSSSGIAIVGTRAASEGALAFTRALAAALAEAGYSIWSGGARGVDAAAHAGALDAGAPTVLVAGGGLARPYPPEHARLFGRVLETGGALLARVPDDQPPLPAYFLQRNALLAALTVATIVVEAGISSGARSTASVARKLGRHLLVVPSAPWEPRGAGCLAELALGARPVTSAADVLHALGAGPPPPPPPARARARPPAQRRSSTPVLALRRVDPTLPGFDDLPPGSGPRRTRTGLLGGEAVDRDDDDDDEAAFGEDERAILSALAAMNDGPAHLDEVCERTGLGLPRAAGALLTLTLHAVVVEGPAGSYRRARR